MEAFERLLALYEEYRQKTLCVGKDKAMGNGITNIIGTGVVLILTTMAFPHL